MGNQGHHFLIGPKTISFNPAKISINQDLESVLPFEKYYNICYDG